MKFGQHLSNTKTHAGMAQHLSEKLCLEKQTHLTPLPSHTPPKTKHMLKVELEIILTLTLPEGPKQLLKGPCGVMAF